jgi:hypothetical protein
MPFTSNVKEWCLDDRTRTSLVQVAYRRSVVVLAIEVLGAGGTPQGAISIERVDAGP